MTPTTVEDYAKEYRRRGWAPLPLGGRDGKVPQAGEGWQHFVADDNTVFDDNVGNILGERSGGLTDADLDCQEAVRMAPALLPPTNSIFGRAGKPNSHWIYICNPPITTVQFQTRADGMLVEMRGNGGQTMFPPSWNRDANEQVEWARDGEPARIDAAELLRAISELAGMSLLVRHWPAETGRYNAEGAFVGTLLRAGRSEAEVLKLLKLIQQHAGAARKHPPEKTVRRLADRLAAGQPIPGLRTFREYLGEEVIDKAAEWMGLRPHGSIYEERAGGIYWITTDNKGNPIEVRLNNFTAHITQVINRDDGSGDIERRFVLEGNRGRAVQVPSKDFDAMHWVTTHWGPWSSVEPGYGKKERLARAIKELSEEAEEHTVYAHLGWRFVDGQWVYLHAAGAIGAQGPIDGITVEIGGELAGFILPQASDPRAAVLAALELLDLNVTIAAATWRAPLIEFCPVAFSVFLAGRTGSFKSAATGVAQAHWGSRWSGVRFASNWFGTANSIEKIAFLAKDCLLVIDDFAPNGSRRDIAGLHRKAEDVLRSAGNLAGRSRMRHDTSLRPTYWPRGLLMSSGEDVPGGHSLRARLAIEQLGPNGINVETLSRMQAAARGGVLAQAMAEYVQWIAGREDPAAWAAPRHQELRAKVTAAHRRTPDITAGLMLGVDAFLQFALDIGAIDEVQSRKDAAWRALVAGAGAQSQELRDEDPVELFLDAVPTVLASGRAHLASRDGRAPLCDASAFGWQQRQHGDEMVWVPQGRTIGWVANAQIWLLPDAAIGEVNAMLREQGRGIPIARRALGLRLREAGRLVEHDEDTFTKVVRVGGSIQRVFVVEAGTLGVTDPSAPPF
jgi:hypothetical protein